MLVIAIILMIFISIVLGLGLFNSLIQPFYRKIIFPIWKKENYNENKKLQWINKYFNFESKNDKYDELKLMMKIAEYYNNEYSEMKNILIEKEISLKNKITELKNKDISFSTNYFIGICSCLVAFFIGSISVVDKIYSFLIVNGESVYIFIYISAGFILVSMYLVMIVDTISITKNSTLINYYSWFLEILLKVKNNEFDFTEELEMKGLEDIEKNNIIKMVEDQIQPKKVEQEVAIGKHKSKSNNRNKRKKR